MREILATIGQTPDPVLIAGPTAVGKSALAMALAERDGGMVVNADALQVHECWRVLSARPSVAEEQSLPHRLYGHVARGAAYSVGHWLRDLAPVLAEARETGRRAVIVGGTGLYFSALTEGLADIPPVPSPVRAEADALRRSEDGLERMIAELDALTAARVDLSNPMRVQRAWEVWRATGEGLAAWQARTGAPLLPLAATTALVLRPDPAWLGARMDRRFEKMVEGALEEARAALPHWDPAAPWARAIGAPELVAHLRGESSLEHALAAAKTATRQYAKRQRTWFRSRMGDWRVVELPLNG